MIASFIIVINNIIFLYFVILLPSCFVVVANFTRGRDSRTGGSTGKAPLGLTRYMGAAWLRFPVDYLHGLTRRLEP